MLKKPVKTAGLRLLLRALAVWLITALLFLLFSSLFLSSSGASSSSLGYLSSAISFLSALAAGIACRRANKNLGFPAAAAVALFLLIVLLSVGFLASDRPLDPSGVLSVASFTLAGVLVGALFFSRRSGRSGRPRLRRR